VPWEIGLAETQQTLVKNKLRDRITVQTDGQLKTGRDVMIAALLGAEEFGFSTAPLISTGCIMMRACHLNTCPVGIATQDPELRKRFRGKPEHVVNFLFFVAEEVRGYMAQLGIRMLDDLIGRTDLLETDDAIDHWKARGVDLTHLLAQPDAPPEVPRRRVRAQDPVLDDHRDHELIERAREAIDSGRPVEIDDVRVQNKHRCVGGILSSEIAKRYGSEGLPEDTIVIRAHGHGGQSFGGWLMRGITLLLEGDANDYTGKGMSGGVLAVRPPENVTFVPEENVVVGNTLLYGATAGRAFFRGLAGERFAVRNSGVEAVVEGVGDHGCEYMTGGKVVVLGATGRNFAAGMSGGMAFVLDENDRFAARCNQEIVELEAPSEDDFADVRALVEEHLERTGSTVAERVLRDWDALRDAWVKVMPLDYKRALRELAERRDVDAGEPAVVAEHGNGDGAGPVRAGQGAPYSTADGHEEARTTGEAGQYEDAAVAAARAYNAALARGASEAEAAQAAEEAEEEVLPSHG
jgi:glutamate synthase (NADPH/NADH) large chain/glutamate synthase (ferredoxin)